MYFIMLGYSYAIEPVTTANKNRTLRATTAFGVAAILGWPFTAFLALPFAVEEVLLSGKDASLNVSKRLSGLVQAAMPSLAMLVSGSAICLKIFCHSDSHTASSSHQAFVFGVDSFVYGRPTLVPWNIVRYNVLSSANPDLYGVSPWYFYILNGILNFNVLLPLAIFSLPLLAITSVIEPKKLGITKPGQTSSSILLALRLMPFYMWFVLLSSQPHKEERFMFPAFPLLCWNAAVSLGLLRGWMQRVYVQLTKAPFNVSFV